MRVGIVVGSVREGRVGLSVGEWALERGQSLDAEVVLIDLKQFGLPVFSGAYAPMAAKKTYPIASVQAWSDVLDACDAFVFVTPEYNHSIPGAFKNAVDSIGPELIGKPVGLVGYGAVAGVRAIEHWRQIMAQFSAPTVRAEVNLSLFTDFAEGAVKPSELKNSNLDDLYAQLLALASKLRG